jgi:demethylmenaquinone methyltransferase/2-methoxy-6-polyprenyl-1,4-benzoquinol methylase
VAELAPPLGAQALDACCGTGDLTLLLAKSVGPGGAVLGTDFSEAMLERARQKVSNSNVEFAIADLLSLPLASGRFDVASLAFGIRNVVDPVAGLRELRRVLRPAGRLLVLEFGQPRNPALASLWAAFSRSVLPRLGGALSGEPAAYEYLPRTSLAFPCGDRFVDGVLRRAGFTPIRTRALWGGIAWIYIGGKP